MKRTAESFRVDNATLLLLALIGSLLSRGYRGISHDGILYIAQAINILDPGSLSRDLFFQYGSQQSFTLFPGLYAAMIGWFGLSTATLSLWLMGRVLFALGLVWLVARLFTREARLPAVLGVLLFSSYYGGLAIFSYGEPFLTGRSIAEPVVLMGLALALERRYGASLLMLAASAVFHPLMGIGVILAVCLLLAGRYRWLFLAAGMGGVIALSLSGVEPFSWLLERYDPDWWRAVAERNRYTVLALWEPGDWARLVIDVAILLMAVFRLFSLPVRPLLLMLLIASAGLFALGLLLGELARVKLIFSLQLWRVHWYLHLLASASALPLAIQLWRGRRQLTASFLLFTVLLVGNGVALVLLLATGALYRVERQIVSIDKMPLLRGLAIAGLAATLVLPAAWYAISGNHILLDRALYFWVIFGTLAAWGWCYWRYGKRGFYLGLIPVLAVTVTQWDQRKPMSRVLMSGQLSDLFDDVISRDSVVYWHDTNALAWVARHMPNYYSGYQGAGLLFQHKTAVEFARRDRQLGFLDARDRRCAESAVVMGASFSNFCNLPYSEIESACKAAPELDFVVVREPGKHAEQALATRQVAGQLVKLYSCEKARKNG